MAATLLKPLPFRFDAASHTYTVNDAPIPHITGMLLKTGWIDDTWFTEEACERGTAVHELTAAYDLGALDPRTLVSTYKGWVLAHVAAMQVLRPTMLRVEEPEVHPQFRFGGRPDREMLINKLRTVYEIKTGAKEKSHQVQTALQAILLSWRSGLLPQSYQRIGGYYKKTGKFALEMHRNRADFDEAMKVIKECCK